MFMIFPYGMHDDGRRPGIEVRSRPIHNCYEWTGDALYSDRKSLLLLAHNGDVAVTLRECASQGGEIPLRRRDARGLTVIYVASLSEQKSTS